MPTMKLRADGMRDAADEERITGALQAATGVYGAVACAADGCIEVDFEDDEISIDEVLLIVQRVGYAAEIAG
jgi:hypothetical protein